MQRHQKHQHEHSCLYQHHDPQSIVYCWFRLSKEPNEVEFDGTYCGNLHRIFTQSTTNRSHWLRSATDSHPQKNTIFSIVFGAAWHWPSWLGPSVSSIYLKLYLFRWDLLIHLLCLKMRCKPNWIQSLNFKNLFHVIHMIEFMHFKNTEFNFLLVAFEKMSLPIIPGSSKLIEMKGS